MKTVFTIIMTIIGFASFGQTDCLCGKLYDENLQKPDTIIKINGVESYAICGYFEDDFVSEFTVTKCGDEKILDFYDATLNYKIEVDADTIKLIDYRFLSTDLNKFERIPWAIDMYYHSNGQTIHKRRTIFKRNKSIIYNEKFQKEWDNEIKDNWSTNNKLILWSFFISLDNKENFENYFKNYRDTFQIGGVYAEYYSELLKMYDEYKK